MCKGVKEEFNKLYYSLSMDYYIWARALTTLFIYLQNGVLFGDHLSALFFLYNNLSLAHLYL